MIKKQKELIKKASKSMKNNRLSFINAAYILLNYINN